MGSGGQEEAGHSEEAVCPISERRLEQLWGPLSETPKVDGVQKWKGEGGLGLPLGLTCPALQKERDREPQLLGGGQPPGPVQQRLPHLWGAREV